MPQRPRIGLALGSGSAKGLAHLGVLRVLEQHTIPIDYIAGSSIGAVIGAFYAQNPTITALEELVYKLSERNLTSVLDLSIKGGLIKGNKIETLLRETLKTDSFDSLQIPFAAIATDLTNADSVSFTRGDLIRALRASSAIPGFLRSIEYDGRFLADGGLSDPVPVDVVRAMGADIVIAVNLDTLYIKSETPIMLPLSRIPSHSINILRHHLALKSSQHADITIAPRTYSGIIAWRDFFTRAKVDEFIAEGARAAEEQMPAIQRAIRSFHRQSPLTRVMTFLRSLKP